MESARRTSPFSGAFPSPAPWRFRRCRILKPPTFRWPRPAPRGTHEEEEAGGPDLSVVLPVYNEVENLPELRQRLTKVLDALGRSWEIVFVNDGSRDGSLELMRTFTEEDKRLRVVSFARATSGTRWRSPRESTAPGDAPSR